MEYDGILLYIYICICIYIYGIYNMGYMGYIMDEWDILWMNIYVYMGYIIYTYG